MDGGLNLDSSGSASPNFIQLFKPGIQGDEDVVTNPDGSKFGSPTTVVTADGVVVSSGDSVGASDAAKDKFSGQLNIATVVTTGDGSVVTIHADQPVPPVSAKYYAEAQAQAASGTSGALNPEATAAQQQAQEARAEATEANAEAMIYAEASEEELLEGSYRAGSQKGASDARAATKSTADALATAQKASEADDLAGTKAAEDAAKEAAAKANAAAAEAESYAQQAVGTGAEVEARKAADEAKKAAEEANSNLVKISTLVKGEQSAVDAKQAVETAKAANERAQAELKAATEAGGGLNVDAAIVASTNAKKAADEAREAAAEAQAAADAAVGTPEEQNARELAFAASANAANAELAAINAQAALTKAQKTIEGNKLQLEMDAHVKEAQDAAQQAQEAAADATRPPPPLVGAEDNAAKVRQLRSDAQAAREAAARLQSKPEADKTPEEIAQQQFFENMAESKEAEANTLADANFKAEVAAAQVRPDTAKLAADAITARDKAKVAADLAEELANRAVAEGLPNAAELVKAAKLAKAAYAAAAEAAAKAVEADFSAIVSAHTSLFFQANAYVTFLVNFMELIKAMSKNKEMQGKLQLASMEKIIQMAEDASASIMAAAEKQKENYMTAAITSGVALAGSCVSLGMTVGSGFAGNKPLKDPKANLKTEIPPKVSGDVLPDANPMSRTNLKAHSDFYEGKPIGRPKMDDVTMPDGTPGKVPVYEWGPDGKQYQVWESKPDTPPSQRFKTDDYVTDSTPKMTQKQINDHNFQVKEEIQARKDWFVENKLEDPLLATGPEKTARQAKVDQRTEDIKTENKKIEDDVAKENREITQQNSAAKQKWMGLGEAIKGMSQQSGEIWKNVTMAANAMEIAKQESLKAMLEAYKAMAQHTLQTATEAFRSDTDIIGQLLQQLDSIRQKLLDAVAAMLRK